VENIEEAVFVQKYIEV